MTFSIDYTNITCGVRVNPYLREADFGGIPDLFYWIKKAHDGEIVSSHKTANGIAYLAEHHDRHEYVIYEIEGDNIIIIEAINPEFQDKFHTLEEQPLARQYRVADQHCVSRDGWIYRKNPVSDREYMLKYWNKCIGEDIRRQREEQARREEEERRAEQTKKTWWKGLFR